MKYRPPDPPHQHPALVGLFQLLPPPGAVWPERRRKEWLKAAEGMLRLIYGTDEELSARGPDGE